MKNNRRILVFSDMNLNQGSAPRVLQIGMTICYIFAVYMTFISLRTQIPNLLNSLTGASEDPEPAEYLVSRSDGPELFDLIKDMIDTKSPERKRLLAYHQKLKADSGQ